MGSIDQTNTSFVPLDVGEDFRGLYSSTTDFSEIVISVETDTTFELVVNFSTDNGTNIGIVKTYPQVIASTTALVYKLQPSLRYFQIVLTNTDTTDQTYLRLTTILKSSIVYEPNSTSTAANVNIVSPLDISDNVLVSDTVSQTFLDTISTNTFTRGHAVLYNSTIGANSNTPFYNLSDKQVKLLTFYGQSSEDTLLTVNFSPDNSTVFKSQYFISVLANTPFGFSLPINPIYVGINSSNAVNTNLTVYIDYS